MINVIARVVAREYWENVAENLSKAGWSWGCVSAIDSNGRTIWIDAHLVTGASMYLRHGAYVSRGTCTAFCRKKIQPHRSLQPKRVGRGNDCERDGCGEAVLANTVLIHATGWVKVPVQFLALAVVAKAEK